jgi:hypothetical protein
MQTMPVDSFVEYPKEMYLGVKDLGVDTRGSGENIRKGFKRVNVVKILCTHI